MHILLHFQTMLSDREVEFVDRGYGNHSIHLLHVRRDGQSRHYVKELEVNTNLVLNNAKEYLYADNSDIVTTNSQKNTVYILAQKYGVSIYSQKFLQKIYFSVYSYIYNGANISSLWLHVNKVNNSYLRMRL